MPDIRNLHYPRKSHRKAVKLPKESAELAEFFGIMMGDGGINNPWQATITLNSVKDADYARYISSLCKRMFNAEPAVRKRKGRSALVLSLASTSIVDFLVGKGLPRGNKLKHGLTIPPWILAKPSFQKACVRGLIDTDGCIFTHTHSVGGKEYKNINLTFTSHDRTLVFQVADIVEKFGIMPHITKRGYDINLYQANAVAKFLRVFGTSNSRIELAYKKWWGARVV